MANEKVIIQIQAKDTEKTQKELSKIGSSSKELGKGFKESSKSAKLLSSSLKALGGVIATYLSARVFSQILEGYAREEDSIKRLNNALKLQGTYTDILSDKYIKFSKSIQKSTRYGDEAVRELMQQLISVGNVAPGAMERATQAALDFAAATGRDLQTAALLVAKAAAGSTGELSRYGIVLEEGIPKAEKFEAVLRKLESRFGGMAQADIDTYSGKLEQLKNAWGDLGESAGKFAVKNLHLKETMDNLTAVLSGELKKATLDYSDTQEIYISKLKTIEQQIIFLEEQFFKLKEAKGLDAQETQLILEQLDTLKMTREEIISQLESEAIKIGEVTAKKREDVIATEEKSTKEQEAILAKEELEKQAAESKKNRDKLLADTSKKYADMSFNAFGNAMGKMALEGGKFKDYMIESFKQIAQTFISEVTAMMVKWLAFKALGVGAGGILGGLFHSGGVVGKYHSGGLITQSGIQKAHNGTLATDEVPIIAQKGEGIISRQGIDALSRLNDGCSPISGNTGSQEVTQNISINMYNPTITNEEIAQSLIDKIVSEVSYTLSKGSGYYG